MLKVLPRSKCASSPMDFQDLTQDKGNGKVTLGQIIALHLATVHCSCTLLTAQVVLFV